MRYFQVKYAGKKFNDEDELKKMAELVYIKYKNKENYIFNLGSGLTPDINPEKVGYFLSQLSSFGS